ncbi:hypothetical protein JJV70_03490 [Streptomyces sp. JJ66]|uniref:hypothetical protein n=1 Tax=Streptomyces sp. JJ66 TaxID=2803843 RepID=UPI001C57D536|nr:hypothetical protein [Streptomyces sp. JJ66]MBW1601180.1 hypothetical protein [Streptomyces sp. JJ66]
MSFFKFATDEVKGMARTLESSGGRMRDASREMQHTDASQVGDSGLQAACDDFADSWNYGFGQLAKLTRGISKVVDGAAEDLTKLDDKYRQELEKASEKGDK